MATKEAWQIELERQNFIYAKPAVKGFLLRFEPEIMFANGQWQAGAPCSTREEAYKIATEHADLINTLMRGHAENITKNLKRAKP